MRMRTLILLVFLLATSTIFAAEKKNLDQFTKCVSQKKVTMYGAFWCSHCKEQKELLGASFKNINYVECGVVGNLRAQTPACSLMMIKRYPTWVFPDGERIEKNLTPEELSAKTGCKAP